MLNIINVKQNRNRLLYFALIIVVIILGLSTRKYPQVYLSFFAKYGGDTLWALTVFLGIGFVFNKFSILKVAILSLIFAYSIEISQLYHAEWIDAIRNTKIGALVLGFDFLWSDIICYTAGVFIGTFFEIFMQKSKNK